MDPISTEAIILKNTPQGEDGILVTALTRDLGKVRAVARGARKMKNATQGGILPMTRSALALSHGKGPMILTQYRALDAYAPIKEDLLRSAVGYLLLEYADLSRADDGDTDIYDLLKTALEMLKTGNPRQVLLVFLIKLTALSGTFPELTECIGCGAELKGAVWFSSHRGGAVCAACRDEVFDPELKPGDFRLWEKLRDLPYAKALETDLGEKRLAYYEGMWIAFLTRHLDILPRSLAFYRQMRRGF